MNKGVCLLVITVMMHCVQITCLMSATMMCAMRSDAMRSAQEIQEQAPRTRMEAMGKKVSNGAMNLKNKAVRKRDTTKTWWVDKREAVTGWVKRKVQADEQDGVAYDKVGYGRMRPEDEETDLEGDNV